MARNRPEEVQEHLRVYRIGDLYAPCAPWRRDEKGQHVYIKLTRGEESALLFVGTHFQVQAEVQQGLMRLVNEGWMVEGEVSVSFDGKSEPGIDPYVYQDPLVIELGRALLPLADPQHGSPLMSKVEAIREEVARESGMVTPSVRICDNMQIDPNKYLVRVKDTPTALGDLFLDRLLVLGSHEQLAPLEGWATVEPVHRMNAKWITQEQHSQAEQAGCIVLGPLAVLMTHIKAVILAACPDLMGVQEAYDLVARLRPSHPVLVEDFLTDRRALRHLRKVLRSLLAERVSLRDLVTILEVCGDNLDRIERTDTVVELCRLALSRQICWNHLNEEGVLRGLTLAASAEQRMLDMLRDPEKSLNRDEHADFVVSVRKAREDAGYPPVLFTEPGTRVLVRRLLERPVPDLAILSTAEIAPGIKVEPCGEVSLTPSKPPDSVGPPPDKKDREKPARAKEEKKEGVLGFLKGG
ncbi:MAG: FHIPEP family type III secretion protein [Candidatus Eremiobacterota bacterium]